MSEILYRFVIALYGCLLYVSAFFSQKARQFIKGRKQQQITIPPNTKPIWFHVASQGEFQQALPLIDKIKKEQGSTICVSFFSPSGYRYAEKNSLIDYRYYLPLDTPGNVRRFVEQIQPKMAIFVKYEYWYFYFKYLAQKKIPLYVISAHFRDTQAFFKPYGFFMRKTLGFVDHFFVQTQQSIDLLSRIGISNASACGDTRLDQVLDLSKQAFIDDFISAFIGQNPCIVLGSSWPLDLQMFEPIFQDIKAKFIIAPHRLEDVNLAVQPGVRSVLYSQKNSYSKDQIVQAKYLWVDQMGLLSKLYRFADVVYVGGGFKTGLHNVLEPLAYKKPIIIGPYFNKFQEAVSGVEAQFIFSVANKEELFNKMQFFLFKCSEAQHNDRLQKTEEYISQNSQSTQKIYALIFDKKRQNDHA